MEQRTSEVYPVVLLHEILDGEIIHQESENICLKYHQLTSNFIENMKPHIIYLNNSNLSTSFAESWNLKLPTFLSSPKILFSDKNMINLVSFSIWTSLSTFSFSNPSSYVIIFQLFAFFTILPSAKTSTNMPYRWSGK